MDQAIYPAGMCTESGMMYVFVNGFNMLGMLLTTFGDQLNTSWCPELGEWLISEVILQKNFSQWPMKSNAWILGRWDQGLQPGLRSSGGRGGRRVGKESWQACDLPDTRRRSGESHFIPVSQFAQL